MTWTPGRQAAALPAVGLAIVALIARLRLPSAISDDAYIVLATVRNALAGLGPQRSRNLVFRAARLWRLRLPRTCLYRAVCARETVGSLRIQPRGLEFEIASSIRGRSRKMPDRRAQVPGHRNGR